MNFFKKFSLFLFPSIFQTGLYIIMLPITTYVLGPGDFGVFALASAFSAFGTVLGSVGASYLIPGHYQIIDREERKEMMSTILIAGMFLSIIFGIVLLLLWPLINQQWSSFSEVPFRGLIFSLLTMILGLPWIFAYDIVVLEGKAALYSILIICQSIVSAAATIVSLYVFHQKGFALFIGPLAGSAVIFIGALYVFMPYLEFSLNRVWLKRLWKLGFVGVASHFAETIQTLIERSVLSVHVGLDRLGIYNHSQQYKSLAMMVMKASARTVWPITLSESREIDGAFPQTKKVWDTVYIFITFLGIFLASLGQYVIALLTHDKFTEAYIFAVLWMVLLLFQHIGKPHTGFLYVTHQGVINSTIMIFATLLGIATIFLFVPFFGLFGAVGAVFVQMIIYRIGIQIQVNRFRKIPFQDWWALIGVIFILVTLVFSRYFHFDIFQNIVLFFVSNFALFLLAKSIVSDLAKKAISLVK